MTQDAAIPSAAKFAIKPARITSLDSLRGIAALIVVFHHLDNVLDEDGSNKLLGPIFHHSPLRILVDGRTAVMLFFILSGFALSMSIGRNFNYWTYLLRRIARLMIPCAVAILIAAGAYYLVQPQPIPELGGWFNATVWNAPLSWGLVLRHIVMTGTEPDTSLINVLWSLVVELRISLIFPFLFFVTRSWKKTAAIGLFAMYFLFRYFAMRSGNYVPFFNKNLIEALENIGYYTPFFIAGILARENIDTLRRWVGKFHWALVIVLLLVAIRLEESGVDFQIGVGAFAIIVLCVCSPFLSHALSVRPIEWLGKISYSLYLIHLTLLATVFHLLHGKVNGYLLALGIVIGSLVLAEVFYRLVESPSIHLSRRFTAKKPLAPVAAA
jgi:peptidoglycan/LPS O-acetylase OafA/YrhL